MNPKFQEGERVWVNRWAYIFKKPKVGDVVVLKSPNQDILILKRIKRIEDRGYFVEGDNPNKSTDSRKFGFVTKEVIIGKVFL